jgi:hypothetical protein
MRPISGFERPLVQWLFVALSIILVATAGGAAWVARHANVAADAARAAEESGRLERQQLDAQLARERSSREALALEVARQRESGIEPARVMPTLTLTPLATRGATPPAATAKSATAQDATQLIELRLVLPAEAPNRRFDIVLRDWSSGDVVWSRSGLASSRIDRQLMVTAFVAGDVFRPGAYELLVTAANAAGQKEEVAAYEIAFK